MSIRIWNCDQKGCDKLATKAIILELRVRANHTPAESTPIVRVCDEHAEQATWDDVVDAKSWGHLCSQFVIAKRPAPLKKYSNIAFKDLPKLEGTGNESD